MSKANEKSQTASGDCEKLFFLFICVLKEGKSILNFNCNVKVVDEMMGRGKTSAAINMINASDDEQRFLFITPYLSEVKRVMHECPEKKFKQPQHLKGRKLEGIKELLNEGYNIISTHALFRRFDLEVIDLCRAKNYTLIMDEVTDVVEQYEISEDDFRILAENFVDIDEDTGIMSWKGSRDYHGKFIEEKRLCELNSLAFYGGSIMMWLFPIEVFNAFRQIYILTYMFPAQLQRYYYDYYGLPYEYLYVTGNEKENYEFSLIPEQADVEYKYRDLIHVLQDEKLNLIGDRSYDLSKAWYERNKDNASIKQLKNNITNFFINKQKSKTSDNLWTTFKDYKQLLTGNGYGRGFAALNMRASNDYRHRTSIAYPVNRYINPCIKSFFSTRGVKVDEDAYALSEMLQFIWRSSIRDGKEIWVYLPSVRMRSLLEEWIRIQDAK